MHHRRDRKVAPFSFCAHEDDSISNLTYLSDMIADRERVSPAAEHKAFVESLQLKVK